MTPVPSRRLVAWAVAAAVSSLVVLALPEAWPVPVAFDLVVARAALLDWLLTPGPGQLEAQRLAGERLSVLNETAVAVVVRNRSRLD